MDKTAAIAELKYCLVLHIDYRRDIHQLEDEDINLAIRWAKKELGIKDE
ncbi:MAG: hypothetical protein DDT26_02448 [Dehalococcoidia bacterium]|nr:hypothetical protein [Chloroflexota bacterium]